MNLTGHAIERGWTVQVVATPAALAFIDVDALEKQTGSPVRSQYSPPGAPRSKVPHAIIVAPATYNTICKWAFGTSDTYALGILAEMTGMDIPVIVLPYVNAALASRIPFKRSVESLRSEGVHFLLGPDGVQPHQPRSGADPSSFPWHLALDEADRLLLRARSLAGGHRQSRALSVLVTHRSNAPVSSLRQPQRTYRFSSGLLPWASRRNAKAGVGLDR